MRPICGGSKISWEIDGDTLRLEGSGTMDFPYDKEKERLAIPWYYEDFTKVSFEGEILSIGPEAFHTSDLTEVAVPDTVRKIDQLAFCSCRSLKKVTFGRHLTEIGPYAFEDCGKLVWVKLGGCVKSLAYSAFQNCTSLRGFESSPLLRTIGSGCFSGCSSLRRFALFEPTERIEGNPFSSCRELTEIAVESTNPAYSSSDGCLYNRSGSVLIAVPGGRTGNFTVGTDVAEIGREAFSGCRISSVRVPAATRYIGAGAFAYCSELTSAAIEEEKGFRRMDRVLQGDLFRGCSGLEEVELPNSIASIEFGAFRDCRSLKRIQLPERLEKINESSFEGCVSLRTVTMPRGLQCIGERAFANDTGLTEIGLNDGLASIGKRAFVNCTALREIEIPESVAEIETGAFKGCTSLERIVLPGEYGNEDAFLPKGTRIEYLRAIV